ncbi:hypothetical protein D3C75_1302560 [compost metagenome]
MIGKREGGGIEQDFLEAFDGVAQHQIERRQEDDGEENGEYLQNEMFRTVSAGIH